MSSFSVKKNIYIYLELANCLKLTHCDAFEISCSNMGYEMFSKQEYIPITL